MASRKKPQFRAEFRKSHDQRRRKRDFTRELENRADRVEELPPEERVSGKGALTRKRTVRGVAGSVETAGFDVDLSVDPQRVLRGRVLRVMGLASLVQTPAGALSCAVRGLLKSLATDLQHTVVAGDWVDVLPVEGAPGEGLIVRVDPRRNAICRTSRGRRQIIVANVDLVLIVASAAEPDLKPNLVDRLLLSAEKAGVQPVIVINKIDLIDPASIIQTVGTWCQLGYPVEQVSARDGTGIGGLRELLRNRDSVVAGQSGVGKSSLLNAIHPGLDRRVAEVSAENQKGRHTTTNAELVPLDGGGHLVDTPGIRSMQLWDVTAAEVEGYFREFRPFVHRCRFPDCSHTHEDHCAVKNAVADGWIDLRRYDSCCQIRSDL